jgi:methionyl-tRNA formyltransferase
MQNKNKKIVFFGTPSFTVDFLNSLKKSSFSIETIVTNPDRQSGRGMEIKQPLPKVWGEKNNIEVLQPEKIDESFIEELSKINPDIFVVIAYGKILPEKLINLPKYGTINVHYSLLPKYRGATPVESAILNGDKTTAVTIQQMRMKLDTGPIIAQKEVIIADDETTPSLLQKLNLEAIELLPITLVDIFENKINSIEQDDNLATYCTKISKEDGEIILTDDPIKNDRKYRAYYGSVGTFFYIKYREENVRVKIKEARLVDGKFVIEKVVPENKSIMTFSEFQKWLSA